MPSPKARARKGAYNDATKTSSSRKQTANAPVRARLLGGGNDG